MEERSSCERQAPCQMRHSAGLACRAFQSKLEHFGLPFSASLRRRPSHFSLLAPLFPVSSFPRHQTLVRSQSLVICLPLSLSPSLPPSDSPTLIPTHLLSLPLPCTPLPLPVLPALLCYITLFNSNSSLHSSQAFYLSQLIVYSITHKLVLPSPILPQSILPHPHLHNTYLVRECILISPISLLSSFESLPSAHPSSFKEPSRH